MAKRRRGMDLAVTFFSFQDIMMCALGVMVLLNAVIMLLLKPVSTNGMPETAPQQDPAQAERTQLVEKVHDLEATVRRAQEGLGRDVDRDLGTVHSELARLKVDQGSGDERLARLIERLGLKSEGNKADAQTLLALELIDQRDSLIQEIDGVSKRRKLVFQVRESDGKRTRIFEVAGHRIVEAFEDSTTNAVMHTFSSSQDGAQIFKERLQDAESKGHAVLVALKPSGVGVFRLLWPNEGDADKSSFRPTHYGIDLITEDGWISDEHPASNPGGK